MRILFLMSIFLTLNATAQPRTSPEVCYQRCTTVPLDEPDSYTEGFTAKLKKIQAMKKDETDPEKLKKLDEAEKNEIEKLRNTIERSCSKFCHF
ncbi:hypothetical protein GCM10011396_27690 [Undibacterium terreum]|uniref:Uncharacterized protein n=2 Tax=Undibacterium terreum TaxID=1224302 RepID=A0A916UMW1_9BURK|nr:hypothetical protein GCM10011396_27690 [Undibacterium terreum]